MKKTLLILTIISLTLSLTACGKKNTSTNPEDYKNITNYDECMKAGNKTSELYPFQCITPDGRYFDPTMNPEEDAAKIAKEYVESLEQFTSDKGQDLKQLQVYPGPMRCPYCYSVDFEYFSQEKNATMQVTIEVEMGEARLMGEPRETEPTPTPEPAPEPAPAPTE